MIGFKYNGFVLGAVLINGASLGIGVVLVD